MSCKDFTLSFKRLTSYRVRTSDHLQQVLYLALVPIKLWTWCVSLRLGCWLDGSLKKRADRRAIQGGRCGLCALLGRGQATQRKKTLLRLLLHKEAREGRQDWLRIQAQHNPSRGPPEKACCKWEREVFSRERSELYIESVVELVGRWFRYRSHEKLGFL